MTHWFFEWLIDYLIDWLIGWLQVEHVIIYKEQQDESQDSEVIVKIFVEFKNFEQVGAGMDRSTGWLVG